MKTFKQFLIEKENAFYFTFGRFNPPTLLGHGTLLESVKKIAGSNDFKIYISNTVDKKKNPLEPKDKLKYLKIMFPEFKEHLVSDASIINPLSVLKEMNGKYKNIVLVVGSDRVDGFKFIHNYNGVEQKNGDYYKYDSIEIKSAGTRDPDDDGAAGMSASKMRQAAIDDDFETFSKGSINNKELFNLTRKGLGL